MKFKAIVDLHLFLVNEKKEILLLRRYNTGYEDGKYSVPAGHLEDAESAIDGIIREAFEEIGIEISKQDLKLCHVMHNMSDTARIGLFFCTSKYQGTIINKKKDKCDDLSWYGIDSLPLNIVPYVRHGIESFKDKKLYSQFGWV